MTFTDPDILHVHIRKHSITTGLLRLVTKLYVIGPSALGHYQSTFTLKDTLARVIKMEKQSSSEAKNTTEKGPGLRHVKTTNAFRIINFELFAKPVRILDV